MDHSNMDTDVLEIVVDNEDLDSMFGRPNNSGVSQLQPIVDPPRLTRTIVNDNYQKPSSNVDKSPRPPTAADSSGAIGMDTSSSAFGGEHANLSPTSGRGVQQQQLAYVDESLFSLVNIKTSLVVSSSSNNNNGNVKEVDGGTKNLRSSNSDKNTKTENNTTSSSDEPMDVSVSAQHGGDTIEDDLTSDPQIAEYKKELGEVERRIQEIAGDDANGESNRSQGETSDSSSDSGSTSSVGEGKKSEHEKIDSGSDSKKRKVSPMAVEDEKKSKQTSHSKHKKRKSSSNGDRTCAVRSKLVKDDKEMKIFFEDSRYFLIKSANSENVILSKAKGVWSTTPRNEQILNKAFRETPNVILVYSVEKSQAFQGFCRLASEADRQGSPVNWVLPPGMNARNLGGVFKVQWINRNEVPFTNTSQLFNPYNEYKPVKIGRDGTELAPNVGRELCGMFAVDEGIDLKAMVKRVKKMQAEVVKSTSSGGKRRSSRYSEMRRQWGSPPDMAPGGVGGGMGAPNRYTKPPPLPPPDMGGGRSSGGWRDHGGSSSAQQHSSNAAPSYGGDGYSSTGRYKDVFINGSYYDYIREYSLAGVPTNYGDPYANMYGAAQPVYNDPSYYGYSGYSTSQMMPSSAAYTRRPPARSSPTREKYYSSRENSDYYRRGDQPQPPRLAVDHRRRHRSQSPDLPPQGAPQESQMSRRLSPRRQPGVASHSHRSKSPRRALSPPSHHKRSGGYGSGRR